MKNAQANDLIAKIIKEIETNSVNADTLVPMLKELREMSKLEEDPLIARSIRLVYEHLEANGGWEFQTLEESEEVEENLTYLISLYAKSENKYNRDEIREIANKMTSEA
ncbi:MAG: hypothetical protein HQ463_02815 [Bacteroidetes bacterium]|nr:hypothetical protein [Bacteroidota bacterium]